MILLTKFGFLVCCFCFVCSEQNETQTAYQSSTLSEYGYVYKAELALDQDDLTYSATVASLSDPAWFTLDLGRLYQSGRLHMNLRVIEKEKEKEEFSFMQTVRPPNDSLEALEIQQAYVVMMNDFDAQSNPPNASIHHVCWKTGELKSFNSFIKSKLCFTETNVTFQYVAVLVPARFQLKVHSIQFIEESKDVALYKDLSASNSIRYPDHDYIWGSSSFGYHDQAYRSAVDDDEETCYGSSLRWLLVDLGRPYLINRVNFVIKLKQDVSHRSLSVITMNDFDPVLNSPNPSLHNICWDSENANHTLVSNSENRIPCVTNFPYRYVVLFYDQHEMGVCDLKVYEACSVGNFGVNCSRSCHCQAGSACHWDSGRCETGCEVGWHGEACDLKDDESEDEFVHLTWSLNGNISIRSSELKKGKHIFLKNRVPLQDWIQVEEREA